jgi:hypothetical protein
VDTRLDKDKAELRVLVLAVALEVLADGNSLHQNIVNIQLPLDATEFVHLLDQHVEILRNLGVEAF